MIPLFLGLQIANHLLLLIVFGVGLWFAEVEGGVAATMTVAAAGDPVGNHSLYGFHVGLGLAAGLFCTLAHISTYMYFMATHKWLWAASDKAGLDPARFVEPARRRKSRAFPAVMGAILATMAAMFAGAAADPAAGAWWSGQVHLVVAAAAIAANFFAAAFSFSLIRQQQQLMDEALAFVNAPATQTPGDRTWAEA